MAQPILPNTPFLSSRHSATPVPPTLDNADETDREGADEAEDEDGADKFNEHLPSGDERAEKMLERFVQSSLASAREATETRKMFAEHLMHKSDKSSNFQRKMPTSDELAIAKKHGDLEPATVDRYINDVGTVLCDHITNAGSHIFMLVQEVLHRHLPFDFA